MVYAAGVLDAAAVPDAAYDVAAVPDAAPYDAGHDAVALAAGHASGGAGGQEARPASSCEARWVGRLDRRRILRKNVLRS